MKIHGTLCDLGKKDIENHLAELAQQLTPAKYICRKCARMSKLKKHLCKAERLPAHGPK